MSGQESQSLSVISQFSNYLGVNEAAFRLLLTILAGYPIALIYRKFIRGKPAAVQHLYSITTGFLLGYWNYGHDVFHSIFTIALSYSILFIIGGTALSVAIIFVYNLVYLLTGYYYTSTDSYDINWTTPQCILVLRLIGIAFDLYDGHCPPEKLSSESKKLALDKCPSILEIFGHTLFPASFMIGPQFPMKRYQDFINGRFNEGDEIPDSTKAATVKFGLGLLYLSIFQVLGLFVSDDLMYSEEFGNLNFFKKLLLLGMWGRYTLYKYISCWLLTEGACILFGLAYNGKDENGAPLWNGVENVKLSTFENTTEFTHYIQSFNTNTNNWVAQYIYKRLKFLGNRHISQFAALLFLAIWHGFHSGYYVCFFFEFIVVYMEREVKSLVKSNVGLSNFFANRIVSLVVNVLLRLYTLIFMGWCLLPFALLSYDRYWPAFNNVYHIGTLVFVLWPLAYGPILRLIFQKNMRSHEE